MKIMILFRRFRKVNAQPDIASIVAAAKDPEITALEQRLAELQKDEIEAGKEWGHWRDEADFNISTIMKRKTADTVKAAGIKLAEITEQRAEINREATEITARIAGLTPPSLAAVTAALEPVRDRAAQDIRDAVAALYAGIALYNSTSAALRSNGGTAPHIPGHLPILDHFLEKVAKG